MDARDTRCEEASDGVRDTRPVIAVRDSEPLDVRGPRQRALLAVLLLHANQLDCGSHCGPHSFDVDTFIQKASASSPIWWKAEEGMGLEL